MIILDDIKQCTGCSLCSDVCPYDAISMVQDVKGFSYPEINPDKCVECGLCRKKCPQNSFHPLQSKKAYAGFSQDKEVRLSSSSGGIFLEICRLVISNGGVVFGVGYDEHWMPVFMCAETLEQCEAFKGSKYAESELNGIYQILSEKISEGRMVLFSGTPCQAAAVRIRFPKADNLYIIDLICNSIPSRKVLNEYLKSIRVNYGNIQYLNMRCKTPSWEKSSYNFRINTKVVISEENKFTLLSRFLNSFKNLFFSHLSVRYSCFNCKYRSTNRSGDLSLGDFWRIDKVCPDMNDGKGTSIILVNSKKGEEIMRLMKLRSQEVEIEKVLNNACIPVKQLLPPDNYNQFWKDFEQYGYIYVAKKYTLYGTKNFVRHRIGRTLRTLSKLLRF